LRKIKTEIEQYLTGLTKADRVITSIFNFPPEFIGFQGHFPLKKILPGACQIQCVLSTIEQGDEKAVVLKEIELAKYFTPVFPDEEVVCTVREVAGDNGESIFKATITKGSAKVTEMKLRVSSMPDVASE
jgi:3-hydroxymyristoyl/3-hydroxydecanoyl-(acyl carrier protein) dehydratase